MQQKQDSQFDMVREYHVWGDDEGGMERRCLFSTFEEAEGVRRSGLPYPSSWKPNRRRHVRFAVAVYRTTPDMQGGVERHRIGTLDEIAPCHEVHAMDEELRKLVPGSGWDAIDEVLARTKQASA